MRRHALSLLALGLAAAALTLNLLNRPPKVGYVQTQTLMDGFVEAKRAKAEFETAQKEWDSNLKRLNDSLNASMERMKAGYDRADEKGRQRFQEDLERRNEDLQRYTLAVKSLAEAKEKELLAPVLLKMNNYLDSWGKKQGYDLVFGTMAGGNIVQADKGMDLTEPILADLNRHYEASPGEVTPGPKADTAGLASSNTARP